MKGVIFDLDGVLCSTDEYHYLAWKALADGLGLPFDRTVNRRLRGVSRERSLEIILEGGHTAYTAEQKAEFAQKKNALYRAFLQELDESALLPDAAETLAALKERGVRIAVGSSSKNTPLILERLKIKGLFDAVADGNEVTRSKPDPEVFLLAARKLQLPPRECLVVEDADSGVEAGRAGGFPTAAIGAAAESGRADFTLLGLKDVLAIV